MRLNTPRFAVALLLLASAACRDSTSPTGALGTYDLTQIVFPAARLSVPANVSPFVASSVGYGSGGEYWITSGSLTLRGDGNFVFWQRDSLYCSYCTPTFRIVPQSFGGHWSAADSVLTTVDTGGWSFTQGGYLEGSNVHVRVPFAGLVGEYVFTKR